MITRLWNWLHSSNPSTWLGHGLQGFVVGAAYWWLTGDTWLIGAALCLLFAFGVREWPKFRTAFGKRERVLLWDAVLDFVSPFIGAILFGWLIQLIN